MEPTALSCKELKIEAPGARAFRLGGALTGKHTPALLAQLRTALDPRPQRLFLDVKPLTQIDRAGMDTLVGLAGVFDDAEGYLGLVGAPRALQEKLAEQAPLRFYDTFAQAAVRVLDDMLMRLSGQFRALPEKPETTEAMKAVWSSIRDGAAGVQVLTLAGNFDKVSAPHFDKHWSGEFKESTRFLVIDVGELRTLVDEGIERFRRMVEAVRARDGRVVLCNARPKIRVMLDMLDMAQLFEFAVSVADAEKSLAPA
ncbi:MAG: STAS domain-containing protein [Planctomycetes bacterium]|nr:STAS domain-containing protein [Planctomycetota bacterium]MCW8135739.1 STAS domain-containing protein [Planctomycetota bacterium]